MQPDDEAHEDWEVYDVGEFSSYGSVISGLSIPALAITLVLAWLFNRLPGAFWTVRGLFVLFATCPYALFLWWAWDKKALRLPDGRILTARDAKRYALRVWTTAMVGTLLWMTGSYLHKPCSWYIESFNSRCQRAAKKRFGLRPIAPSPVPTR